MEFENDRLFKESYDRVAREHSRLSNNLLPALENFLQEAKIEFYNLESRIKDFDSFADKIQRKSYANPLEDIEDICGLRIVCFYHSDMDKISELISREFTVKET